MSSSVFIQYDGAGRFLACGFFPPPGLIGLKPGQTGSVFTALVLDAPDRLAPCQVAAVFLETKIDPPCFWLPFSALGSGREIAGQALTLDEAAARAELTREGLKKAIARGDLPSFRAARQGKGQRAHLVNSLDLERFLSAPRRPPGRPTMIKAAKPPAKPRGRPRKAAPEDTPKKRD